MYRRSRFLIGLLAATLTFGGLMATVGPEHFQRAWHCHPPMGHCCMYNDDRMDRCGEHERFDRHERHDRYDQDEPAAAPVQDQKADSLK